ncbi:ABC transporter permease [Anaerocolumna sp.]|uniref:ABC transporter permease n=1 Tax=Anaerocolumna sp. TaxID=2041569 RepID=UPI0028A7A21E|nr:ABC transporter permease [Anaerocolumna sp.]
MNNINIEQIPWELFQYKVTGQKTVIQEELPPSPTFLQDAWGRLCKNKGALASMFLLAIIIVLAFLAPLLAPYNPNTQNIPHANLPPRIPGISIDGFNGRAQLQGKWIDKYVLENVPKDINYIFGTDEFGRDLLSRALYGTRISLTIAFIAAILDLTIGVFYGLFSALKGGRVDNFMQRILEILTGIPNLVLVVLMLLIFKPGILSIIFALTISSWIPMARIVRGQTLRIKNLEYVQAAKALGSSQVHNAISHILPNIAGIVVVRAMFSIPSAIFFETFLSFIGVGMKIPNASLGTLLNGGYKMFRIHPYQMWIPSVILCIIMLAFNLLADGLRDALDPKMKE